MTTKTGWMLYGANGSAGRRVAREAVALGERPLLAGRSAEKIRPLAEELGLAWVAFDLRDRAAAVAEIRSVELVLLAAGPFDGLAQAMMDACLEARAHYADLANELPVFEAAQRRDSLARERNVLIVPGIGFGTVASGSLVKRVVAELPDAVQLECALHIESHASGAATRDTVLSLVRLGGRVRREGRLVEHPLGAGGRWVTFADRRRRASPVAIGDLEAAWMDTRIPNITAYSTALPGGLVQRVGLAILRRLLGLGWIRKALASGRREGRPDARCHAWASARDARGRTVEAWLEAGEGNAFTAASAARAVPIIRRSSLTGARAASAVLGPSFAESLPGVRVSGPKPSSQEDGA